MKLRRLICEVEFSDTGIVRILVPGFPEPGLVFHMTAMQQRKFEEAMKTKEAGA